MSKFSIGEAVIIQSVSSPELNGTETTILRIYKEDYEYSGVGYDTEVTLGDDEVWHESALRKLPPPETLTSWEDCAFIPEGIEIA